MYNINFKRISSLRTGLQRYRCWFTSHIEEESDNPSGFAESRIIQNWSRQISHDFRVGQTTFVSSWLDRCLGTLGTLETLETMWVTVNRLHTGRRQPEKLRCLCGTCWPPVHQRWRRFAAAASRVWLRWLGRFRSWYCGESKWIMKHMQPLTEARAFFP